MKKYCEVCQKEVETKIIIKNEVYNVLGDDIKVEAKVLICSYCNEELFSEELDNNTLVNAFNIYRKKHKLLLPNEIKEIREMYGISQRSFSKLLNWGDKTIHRYENGSIQDKAHNSLLLFLRKPENMRSYLMENDISLDFKKLAKLNSIVDDLILKNNKDKELIYFEYYKKALNDVGITMTDDQSIAFKESIFQKEIMNFEKEGISIIDRVNEEDEKYDVINKK